MSERASLSGEVMRFLSDPNSRQDPYPLLRRLQAEEPVHRTPFGAWLVTRYADVRTVLTDRRFSVDLAKSNEPPRERWSPISPYSRQMMSMRDGPDHARLHHIIARWFTPAAVARARSLVENIVDRAVTDPMANGRIDVISQLGRDLPVDVSYALLSLPDGDQACVRKWAETVTHEMGRIDNFYDLNAERDVIDFAAYCRALSVKSHTGVPGDLLATLVRALNDGRLNDLEFVSFCMMLLISGKETVTGMLGNSIATLLMHPAQLRQVRADPKLIPSALEECLRFESPLRLVARIAAEDVPLHEHVVRRGEVVLSLLAAANRDPDHFSDPDQFDIGREGKAHLAFGCGPHFCLGYALARLEGEVVLRRLLDSVHVRLSMSSNAVRWSESLPFRIPAALPLEVT